MKKREMVRLLLECIEHLEVYRPTDEPSYTDNDECLCDTCQAIRKARKYVEGKNDRA